MTVEIRSNFEQREVAMEMDPHFLRQKIVALSNKEILQLLHDNPGQYHPEALEAAKEECAKRGLKLHSAASGHASGKLDIFLKSVSAGAKAFVNAWGPGIYKAGGLKIVCPHCKSEQFESEYAFAGHFGANISAYMLICRKCGMIQWFRNLPDRE
jgi:hypothetical protein